MHTTQVRPGLGRTESQILPGTGIPGPVYVHLAVVVSGAEFWWRLIPVSAK